MNKFKTKLAIDACSTICSVALQHNELIYEKNRSSETGYKHSDYILSMIDEVLKMAGCPLANIQSIVFTNGPGSFTSTRLCFSVCQAIAFVYNIPVLALSSLYARAYNYYLINNKPYIAVAIKAQLSQVYWAMFDFNTKKIYNNDESLMNTNDVNKLPSDYIGLGNGWQDKKLLSLSSIININTDDLPLAVNMLHLSNKYNNNDYLAVKNIKINYSHKYI